MIDGGVRWNLVGPCTDNRRFVFEGDVIAKLVIYLRVVMHDALLLRPGRAAALKNIGGARSDVWAGYFSDGSGYRCITRNGH